MTGLDWVQIFFFFFLIVLATPFLGKYMAAVFTGHRTFLHPYLGWLERLINKVSAIDVTTEMRWTSYAKAWMIFNLIGFFFLFLLQIFQSYLPLNPENMPNVPWALAFNTAVSFTTNTDWQAYSGETTLSYLTQMLGLTVQNFLSAASGFAPFLVMTRGLSRKETVCVGNFWQDIIRSIVYILLPLSIILGVFLAGQGVVQTIESYVKVVTLENDSQVIPLGPVASQVAIKQLGTNGGGFFNANSAHPFENPTPLSNLAEMVAILLLPAASVYAFGMMVGNTKHSWVLFAAMTLLWTAGLGITIYSESVHNNSLNIYPVLEGQETRFGSVNSLIWSVSTTATSNGSTNTMISSLSPLSGGICMFNIMAGEFVFGGIGVGMCSMLMLVLLTVFLSGLMVGRTPEYFGKKIERHEVQWIVLGVLYQGGLILLGAGISCILPAALSSLGNQGPHGLSEILYAFSSASGNNGSAFAGLNANTDYFNIVLGVVMLLGRLAVVIPSIAIGGLLAIKKTAPYSLGTFSTDKPLFFMLLICIVLLIGALTFFIPLILGPIVEHMLMRQGVVF